MRLISDNAPGHPDATLLDLNHHVNVVLLPLNTTSFIQSMDQGVIKIFKALYARGAFYHFNEAMMGKDNDMSVEDF